MSISRFFWIKILFFFIPDLQTIHFPIYYCYDNYEILKIYQSLQEGGDEKKQDELMFIVRAEEPKIIPALVMEDFYVECFYYLFYFIWFFLFYFKKNTIKKWL